MDKYLVLKINDISECCPDRMLENLQEICKAVANHRQAKGKQKRHYMVVSDKDSEEYQRLKRRIGVEGEG